MLDPSYFINYPKKDEAPKKLKIERPAEKKDEPKTDPEPKPVEKPTGKRGRNKSSK